MASFKNVPKNYNAGGFIKHVVNVGIDLARRDNVGIYGADGVNKTTLKRLISGQGQPRALSSQERAVPERRERASLLMVSHDPHTLEQYCRRGVVLYAGNLTFYDSVAEACEVGHGSHMRGIA